MPSEGSSDDPGLRRAFEKIRGPFASSLARTLEQARGVLAAQRPAQEEESAGLGTFDAGRVDAGRFAALLRRERTPDPEALARMEAAFAVLLELAARGPTLYEAQVEPGGSLRDTVAAALAAIGRAFGAARLFELARLGRFREAEHGDLLHPFPFGRWNRSERAVAPPLLVTVHGADLRAEGLAEFLDGAFKAILLVRGDAPLAALARLATPGTFVQQAANGTALDRFAAWDGPGIAALVPEGAAHFLHDPAAGATWAERIEVAYAPEMAKPPRVGGRTATQQLEDLRHLAALATPPAPAAAAPEAVGAATGGGDDAAGRLAAWLLSQAQLEDL